MLPITLRNDGTGNGAVGNYDYKVTVNGLVVGEGRVEGHERGRGWQGLVRMFIEKVGEKKDNAS